MIYKVIQCTKSSRNPLFYNVNKAEQGIAEMVAVRNIKDNRFGTILRAFLERDAMSVRTEKVSIHLVLSGDTNEKLTDAQAVELIDKTLKDVGLNSQPYVIFRHNDTDNVHYHVVSTKIKENGKSVIWNGIAKRLINSLNRYQEEYHYVSGKTIRKKKASKSRQNGLARELNDKIDALIKNTTILSPVIAKIKMLREGVHMCFFKSKHTKKQMIKLLKNDSKPIFIDSQRTEQLTNTIQNNLDVFGYPSGAFVIHGDMDASLYVRDVECPIINEAARTILRYYTWSADIRHNPKTFIESKEFFESAFRGRKYGYVQYNKEIARFFEKDTKPILENPEEVITFYDSDLNEIDLITPAYREELRRMLEMSDYQHQKQMTTRKPIKIDSSKNKVAIISHKNKPKGRGI